MSGGTTTNTATASESAPWAPSIPYLTNVLGQIGNANTSPTPGQSAAAGLTSSEAGSVPSYAAPTEAELGKLFNFSTNPELAGLNSATSTTQGALSPYLNPNFTNPMSNPELSTALATIGQQTQQNVDSLFSAAGRDPAGNAQAGKAAATATANAEAPLLTGEYNALTGEQLSAANQYEGNAGNAATLGANLSSLPLTLGLEGISGVSSLPGIVTQPGNTQMAAANETAGLPLSNLTGIEQLLDPVAALGGQTQGNTTQTQQTSAISNMLAGGLGLAGLLAAPMTGGTSLFGTMMAGLKSPFSGTG
jgi:hypothetical protein